MEQDIANRLLPRPRQIELGEGRLVLGDGAHLIVAGPAPASFAGERLAELLREEFGVSLPVAAAEGKAFQLTLLPDGRTPPLAPLAEAAKTLDEEGYRLEIGPAGARVQSPTAQGLLWGAMTLRQCLAARKAALGPWRAHHGPAALSLARLDGGLGARAELAGPDQAHRPRLLCLQAQRPRLPRGR